MQRENSIFSGALLLTASGLLLRLISIGFNVFLTRRIGAAGLGLLQLIGSVSFFVLLLGSAGIRVSAMYLAAEEFGHSRPGGVKLAISTCLRWGFFISAAVGFALVLTASPISDFLLHDPRAALSLRCVGLFLPCTVLCGILGGYFTARGKVRQLVVIELAERPVSLAITALLLLRAGDDLANACCSVILGSSLGCFPELLLLYAVYRRDLRGIRPQGERMPERLRSLAAPLALNDLLRAGLTTTEQLLIPWGLARFAGSSEQAMADYGIIHAMVFPILMFPATFLYSLSDLLVPELSRSRAMGRRLRITSLADRCLRMEQLFAAAVSGFCFLCADRLSQTVYGVEGTYLRLLAPAVLLLYLDAVADGMLKGMAEQLRCVRYNTFTSLLDVVLLLLLLPRWGIGGYLFSFYVTHGINLFLSVRRWLMVTQLRPAVSDFLRPLACLLTAALPCLCLRESWLRGGIFLLLYPALTVLTDGFSAKDRRWLRHVIDMPRKIG